jgi:hypothetical protein
MLFIKAANGIVGINPGTISRVEFDTSEIITTSTVKRKLPSIRIELERPAEGQKVSVSYLARGITWSPSYLIDLSNPGTARISANAVIVNELADFDNVQLELVTGFPKIKFGEVLSPVAMSQNLADFLNSLALGRTEYRGRNSNMLQQQALVLNQAEYESCSLRQVSSPNIEVKQLASALRGIFMKLLRTENEPLS